MEFSLEICMYIFICGDLNNDSWLRGQMVKTLNLNRLVPISVLHQFICSWWLMNLSREVFFLEVGLLSLLLKKFNFIVLSIPESRIWFNFLHKYNLQASHTLLASDVRLCVYSHALKLMAITSNTYCEITMLLIHRDMSVINYDH